MFLNPKVPSHRRHHGSGPGAAQLSESAVFEGNGVQRVETSYSPLSKEIITLRFPKKFVMPIFDHYLGTSDPFLYLYQYQHKMTVYARDNLLLYRVFLSSLKGVAYHLFYSLPRNSLQNFHDVTDTFFNQFFLKKNTRGTTTTSL